MPVPKKKSFRGWRLGIPMMLLEYPAHPDLCHKCMVIVDNYLIQLTGSIPTTDDRKRNNNNKT